MIPGRRKVEGRCSPEDWAWFRAAQKQSGLVLNDICDALVCMSWRRMKDNLAEVLRIYTEQEQLLGLPEGSIEKLSNHLNYRHYRARYRGFNSQYLATFSRCDLRTWGLPLGRVPGPPGAFSLVVQGRRIDVGRALLEGAYLTGDFYRSAAGELKVSITEHVAGFKMLYKY